MNTPIPPDHPDASSFSEEDSDIVRDGFFADLQSRPVLPNERTERLWAAIAQEAQLPAAPPASRSTLRRIWPMWAAAAAITLLIGVSVVLNRTSEPWALEVAFGQPATEVRLDGGAVAVVRPGSRVEAVASSDERVTYRVARGEAWFDVESRPDRVFEVEASGMSVEVLGTAFSVRATAQDARVALERGRVRVRTRSDTLYLAPGEGALSSGNALSSLPAEAVAPMLAWRSGVLDLRHMPLALVLEELALHYGIALEAGSALERIPLSGRLTLDVRPESTLYALSVSVGARLEATSTGFRLATP